MSGGAVDSGRHKLSENIWFVCSKCHIVEIWRDVTLVHTHTDTRNVKKELEFWKQNSQYDSQLNVELRKLKLGKEKGQIDVPQRSELNVRKLANLKRKNFFHQNQLLLAIRNSTNQGDGDEDQVGLCIISYKRCTKF